MKLTLPHISALRLTAALLLLITGAFTSKAFSPDTYATASALSEGRWVKVSVESTGMHFIPAATLHKWGFTDPTKVHVHGYGGQRISDVLSAANYVDDLPECAVSASAAGVYFYAQGPVSWSTVNGQYVQSLNPFSTKGYYFITETAGEAAAPRMENSRREPENPATTFTERTWHEVDLVTLGKSGMQFFGEDFRLTPRRSFDIALPGRVEGTPVWMRTRFVTESTSPSTLAITINDSPLAGSAMIGSTSGDNYGAAGTFDRTFDIEGERFKLGLQFNPSGTVKAAHLDAISVNYERFIAMPADGSALEFEATNTSVSLRADGQVRVWDVTKPGDISEIPVQKYADGQLAWVNSYTGRRRYAAWREGGKFPEPAYVSAVANQNLHGVDRVPDMVIFTVSDWAGEAERLAAYRRNSADSLDVMVVDQELVFNEFASGAPDVNSFRRMLKMLYDRGQQPGANSLRYVLFMGRATHDNRVITTSMKALKQKFMPTWQTDESLREINCYSSDDLFAFLEDNSGRDMAQDLYCIGVGRLPVRSVSEAKIMVDRIIDYETGSNPGMWRAQAIIMADDADGGQHMDQSDAVIRAISATPDGRNMMFEHVYADAFPEQGGTNLEARKRLFRKIDEGTLFWHYLGHGSMDGLSKGLIITRKQLDEFNQRHQPFLAAYTCSFMTWDTWETSGAEMLAMQERGGLISVFSAIRKSYISANGTLSEKIASQMFLRDSEGRFLPQGEAIRRGKNLLTKQNGRRDDNKLRFALLGDPAMRLGASEMHVNLETIDGETVAPDKQLTIKARQNVRLTGTVTDRSGNRMTGFNGPLYINLFDAETSVTTLGRDRDGTTGVSKVYDEPGLLLYQGRDSVRAGEFAINISMPLETADNFRPATLQLYAHDMASDLDASGVNSDFYVYGTDETAEADTIPPVIEYALLNHTSFRPGQTVNESPMFIAEVSDNVGINMSMAGIGHQMSLRLDDRTSYSDLSLYYTPAADGTPGGSIQYPLSGLSEGDHSLTLRVWDTSGNTASHTIPFKVRQGEAPTVFDIYTDANPATDQARFYLSHNRPDATLTVTFEVYNMLGRRVWSSSVTDRSDMFQSAPVTWNLTDMGGHRVTRGIYIYRAILTTEQGEIYTKAKRIAVAGGR